MFTTACTPFMVPNSPRRIHHDRGQPRHSRRSTASPAPARDSGACIGLAENDEDMGPQPVPRSTISSSP